MKQYKYEYSHPITSGNGNIEAENLTAAKDKIKEFIKNDPLTEERKIRLKDVKITVEEQDQPQEGK